MNRPISAQVSAPTALAGAADVRITRIETIPLKIRLDRTAVGANLKFTHRCAIVTRVFTDAGVIGECFNGNDDELQAAIIRVIADEMTSGFALRPASTARCMMRSASLPACRCTCSGAAR